MQLLNIAPLYQSQISGNNQQQSATISDNQRQSTTRNSIAAQGRQKPYWARVRLRFASNSA